MTRKIRPSSSEIAERMPKWWRSQPPRRVTLPLPVRRMILPLAIRRSDTQLLRMKNIRFIQLFVFYMILTNGYHGIRILICDIFGTILYYLQGFIARFLFFRFITHT